MNCDLFYTSHFHGVVLSFGITYFTMLLQGLVHILHYYT